MSWTRNSAHWPQAQHADGPATTRRGRSNRAGRPDLKEDSEKDIKLGRQVEGGALVDRQQDTSELADSIVAYSDSVKP